MRVGAGRNFDFFSDFESNLIKYLNIPCIHTKKSFYRNLIVDAQNQQFGVSQTSIFPYKQCKVLFFFSALISTLDFQCTCDIRNTIPKKLHKLE